MNGRDGGKDKIELDPGLLVALATSSFSPSSCKHCFSHLILTFLFTLFCFRCVNGSISFLCGLLKSVELNASDMVFTCEGRERCPVQQCIGEELAIGNGVYQYFNQIYHLVTHELGFLRYLEEIFPERPVA